MNILVVDDDRFIRKIVSAVIIEAEHTPIEAANDIEALDALEKGSIDLVLTDVEMPGRNGFELTAEIRKRFSDNWFPIIFLTGSTDEKHYELGINAGGDDYLTKPVSPIILTAKIHAMERIINMKQDLDKANARLERLSSIDPLTKVYNRRYLEKQLLKEWKRSQRHTDEHLSAIMLDIDFFKPYNDNYGHQKGDACLKDVAKTLSQCLHRSHDLLARYGGEEFAIILPETDLKGAQLIAETIIHALEEKAIPHEYSSVAKYITASIGISSTEHGADTPHVLLQQADTALYAAKEAGRKGFKVFRS